MIKKYKLSAILSVFFLTTLACARTSSPTPTVSPTTLPSGESIHTLTHDGLERSYILHIPASINWDQPVPLVLVFHGGTGNAESAIRMSGFNEVSDQNDFIVAYPNGTGRLSDDKLLTWNAGTCCGFAQEKNIDDVGFARAIVTDLQTLVNIDAKRIYAAGMSNGGMLSHRLACEATDIFAAIAPVAGTLNFSTCNPSQSISVIEFHGTGDAHLPYDGGFGPESLVDVDFVSVKDSVDFWVSFNGCTSGSEPDLSDEIQLESWIGCSNNSAVQLYTIIDGGHAWPGGGIGWPGSDEPTRDISASELIWEFFLEHPKP